MSAKDMNVIVTGATGFVGSYMLRELAQHGHHVIGTYFDDSLRLSNQQEIQFEYLDVCNELQCNNLLNKIKPDAVIHLAGLAHTTESEKKLNRLFEVNVGSISHIANALKNSSNKLNKSLLIVSSAFVYGDMHSSGSLCCSEKTPLQPRGSYGQSKLAAESVGKMYESTDLNVYIARPFNHIGPGQSPSFVISGFAKRINEALNHSEIETGNLNTSRDFTDVRDIVRGYRTILEQRPSEKTFVFGSGITRNVKEVFFEMCKIANKTLTPKIQNSLIRNEMNTPIYADPSLAQEILGWKPEIPFLQSLQDILASH